MSARGIMRECPKCGLTGEHSRNYVPRMGIYSGPDGMPHIGPCMVRACTFCGYSYHEPTEDENNG